MTLKTAWQETLDRITTAYRDRRSTVLETLESLTSENEELVVTLIENSLAQIATQVPEAAIQQLRQDVVVLAVGGFGRREMFPYSDVDILITYENGENPAIEPFSSEFVRQCWDTGLKLGHAIRSISQTINLVREESQVATALVHARVLWGNPVYHEKLQEQFVGWLQ